MTRTVQNPRSPRRTRWSKNDHRRTEARRNTEKETILEAKEEVYRLKTENERESKERRSELQRAERRLQQKEESFDKKQDTLEQREQQLAKRIKAIDAKEASVSKLYDAQQQELERVAGMTQDEAKDVLLNNVEKKQGTRLRSSFATLNPKQRPKPTGAP